MTTSTIDVVSQEINLIISRRPTNCVKFTRLIRKKRTCRTYVRTYVRKHELSLLALRGFDFFNLLVYRDGIVSQSFVILPGAWTPSNLHFPMQFISTRSVYFLFATRSHTTITRNLKAIRSKSWCNRKRSGNFSNDTFGRQSVMCVR